MRNSWTAALAATLLGGCMSGGDYAERAVEHNRAIEQAADEIVLLNIVRTQHDRPVVYTQFSGVTESFSNSAGVSLSLPFGADAGSYYNAGLSAGPSQYATLSTAPLDDVDYYQGVMRPVKIGLLGYYLDNGWPADLLMALTVEKLSISEDFYARVVAESDALCAGISGGACGRIKDPARRRTLPASDHGYLVFVNDRRNPDLFDPFHDLTLRLVVLGVAIDGASSKSELRIPASAGFTADGDTIEKLISLGAEVRREGGDYVVSTWNWTPALKLTRLGHVRVRIEGDAGDPAEVDMTASLRSPDSILFYLGAYAREGGADADVLMGDAVSGRFMSVFEIGGCTDALVETEFEGECYGIPRGGDHVSIKVVAFLHQVFGLNKRAVEPPSSGTVRVID